MVVVLEQERGYIGVEEHVTDQNGAPEGSSFRDRQTGHRYTGLNIPVHSIVKCQYFKPDPSMLGFDGRCYDEP
jgi:hypothetical protein